ncbi:hypothetical protein BU26DRAFT_182646 [Trematosphaeria pertusa]|uniref:Uncharacterized protein n=1 Tax=Trematosphaeria pertusa TaxID=390896 RepID=A0A6A6HTT0_9PLEO|nr:uncharacterized protein BU26DRAFT_182646 [Trematosphaeria pertusa]KAF2241192.1 hypothetical protein BU26DRAFT_182646 [Trematosphaeria pertusa]
MVQEPNPLLPLSCSIATIMLLVQSVGRIVRFGQSQDCFIVQIYVEGSFNKQQIMSSTRNALAGLAAMVSQEKLSDLYDRGDGSITVPVRDLEGFVLYNGTLFQREHPQCPAAAKELKTLTPTEVLAY